MSSEVKYNLHVPKDFEYVDQTLSTASWYDKYVIKAGTYPIRFQKNGSAMLFDHHVAHGNYVVEVDSVLTETHRVDRLLTESKSWTEEPQEIGSFTFRNYSYLIGPEKHGEAIVYSTGKSRMDFVSHDEWMKSRAAGFLQVETADVSA